MNEAVIVSGARTAIGAFGGMLKYVFLFLDPFYCTIERSHFMTIARKLGIVVLLGVPAIVGGGILYAAFDNFTSVFIYAGILLLVAGSLFSR